MNNGQEVYQKVGEENLVTTKEWVLNLFLLSIPMVGFILLLVWAFGDDNGNKTKKNFSRGYLIYSLIVLAVIIVIYVVIGALIFAAFKSLS